MGLKLESRLPHQVKAIELINQVFDDVKICKPKNAFSNPNIDLQSTKLIESINGVIKQLPLTMQKKASIDDYLNLDIKMETGTGKTYVYTQTMYELHKNYGFNKFIILVPSLAIKMGTKNFIRSEETRKHFRDQYNTEIDLFVLESKKGSKKNKNSFPSTIREFITGSNLISNRINVLLVNMQLFKDNSMLTKDYSSMAENFYNPADGLNATRPVIIIDEPHRFSKGNKTFKFIEEKIKPQMIIRYGATFPEIKKEKDYHNLIYNLGSCDSFNQNLVKGVKVNYLESPSDNDAKVKLLATENRKNARMQLTTENGKKSYDLEKGDSLALIHPAFENIFIEGIGRSVELSNGKVLEKGSEIYADVYATSYQESMIRKTLDSHFETEKNNFKRNYKIKSLALFFIDDIDSYRKNDKNPMETYLKDIFEKLLKEKLEKEISKINESDPNELYYKEYLLDSLKHIHKTHGGYFAKDNNDTDENIADEISKILERKEETLSIENKDGSFNVFRFIFSKWTLKEGWDNPNVFTIAKLRSSGSENSKIQEVGRGLRLPVNENKNRVSDEQFYLNYIIDFTEKDFATKLINEINGDIKDNYRLSEEKIKEVAQKNNLTYEMLLGSLLVSGYIDANRNIVFEKREELFNDYPEFSVGLYNNKIIDVNKANKPVVKIRKERYKEIAKLWKIINEKYFINYDKIEEDEIIKSLLDILNAGVKGTSEIISRSETVAVNNNEAYVVREADTIYGISDTLKYNKFLEKIYKSTTIPINTLHKTFVKYNHNKKIENDFFNENTLINFINKIAEWKRNTLFGRFSHKKTNINSRDNKISDSNGNAKEFIAQADLGRNVNIEKKPSDKYLYDLCVYDSTLEMNNITTEVDNVVVFAKMPSRSIRIPIVGGGTYSPDFMYVVEDKDGKKELNLVIETKDYKTENDIPIGERFNISCAQKFFEQLKEDGYEVKFRTQIRNSQISSIIRGVVEN